MGRIKKRGKAGAAKNYISRNQALKKLQISLSDFRRLCILKGIFPRQPRHIKRANKGSSAPASFYYAKDIAYLQHEPVLRGLREHKAFAKKLSRAIGRGEWALAKNLNDHKPTYRIDHIIKERYPVFTDSLRDLDDALSLLTLFANLPANDKISADVVENCTRLCAQWQSYVMRTNSLRKVFLSIKGVYFQASVQGQTVTWLVPYMFTQHVPADVDFRIMMTFLELYQTLLGFVLFKLYSDEGLVYPPKLDESKDQAAAGLSALILTESSKKALTGENNAELSGEGVEAVAPVQQEEEVQAAGGKKITSKDVKKQIRAITRNADDRIGQEEKEFESVAAEAREASAAGAVDPEVGDEFVAQPSSKDLAAGIDASKTGAAESSPADTSHLFTPFRFFLSREVPRSMLEFILRAFGTKPNAIGWDTTSSGAGAAFGEADERITHVIIDRPLESAKLKRVAGRKYVQPQWVVDCVNRGRILDEDEYAPGKTLPAHLSPFVDEREVARRGGYVPEEARKELAREDGVAEEGEEENEDEVEDDESDDDQEEEEEMDVEDAEEEDADADAPARPALDALLANPADEALLDAAELEAEANGGEDEVSILRTKHAAALKAAEKKARKESGPKPKSSTTSSKKPAAAAAKEDDDAEARSMARALLSNRKRKLYDKMSYTHGKKAEETERLEKRKREVDAAARREKREEEKLKVKRTVEAVEGALAGSAAPVPAKKGAGAAQGKRKEREGEGEGEDGEAERAGAKAKKGKAAAGAQQPKAAAAAAAAATKQAVQGGKKAAAAAAAPKVIKQPKAKTAAGRKSK
ncbi:mRNA-binding ribosome synthesis protein nop7 [Tilletia horrida]|nr:mRNA-binding ribosome synthesis protein nop7 [Tilletia horrida]